jgi:hypothetical protein
MGELIALGLVGVVPWIIVIPVIGAVLKWALRPTPPPQVDRRFRYTTAEGKPVRERFDWHLVLVLVAAIVVVAVIAGLRQPWGESLPTSRPSYAGEANPDGTLPEGYTWKCDTWSCSKAHLEQVAR